MQAKMLEEYHYTELPWESKSDTIRLIELLPGSKYGDEPIICIISEASLQDAPAYEALSYCWGNADVRKTIIIRDQLGADFCLSVRTNLFAALHQFRDTQDSKHFWADAICINQSDLDERRRQVLLMRQIYSGAQETRIWLGLRDENSLATLNAFIFMNRLVLSGKAYSENKDTRSYFEMGVQGQKEYRLPHFFLSSSFKNFSALLEREWFTRVWIIQEVAVSKVVSMWCGGHHISWQDFTYAVSFAITISIPLTLNNVTSCQRIAQLEVARRHISGEYRQSLLTLLTLYRNFNATDPRDKIYSLLGIEPNEVQVDPDYTITTSEVYRRFAVSVLEQRKSLDILGVPRVSKPSHVGELPSWVVDWSVSDFALNFAMELSEEHSLHFKATPSSLPFIPHFQEDYSILGLEGHVVDEIEEIGEVHSHHVEGELTWLQRMGRTAGEQSVLNGWEKICKVQSGYRYLRTGEDIIDAYWQTLCAGQMPQGFEVTKAEYAAWERSARRPARFVPTSKFLNFTHGILSIPVILLSGVALVTSGMPLKEIMSFRSKMTVATQRRMVRTKQGLIGLAPELARKGDFVCLFKGGMVPLVMRKVSTRWMLIGDSYVHGIMNGEGFEETKCEMMWIQ